mgnify:CR=1 FL=1
MCCPYPQFGFFNISMYLGVMSFTIREMPVFSEARRAFSAEKKGVSKPTQVTYTPAS